VHPPLSDIARKRLEMFAATSDGFKIAEADLQLRGPGEMFGVRQSGLPEFRSANLVADRDLIEAARNLVQRLFSHREHLDDAYARLYRYLNESAAKRMVHLGGG